MTVQLFRRVNEGDLELRMLFADTLVDAEFQEQVRADAQTFHATLHLAEQRNWVHYSQLAERVGLSPAHTSKMFKGTGEANAFTPSVAVRIEVLTQLSRLLGFDVDRMRRGKAPVGHLTVAQKQQVVGREREATEDEYEGAIST